MRGLLIAVIVLAGVGLSASPASAATLTQPTNGAIFTHGSFVTFEWASASDEFGLSLELSMSPDLSTGRYVFYPALDTENVRDITVGAWYWRVCAVSHAQCSEIRTLTIVPPPACSDGLDNDGDGQFDLDDWACADENGVSEVLTKTPALTIYEAVMETRSIMRKKFGAAWRHGYAKRVECKRTTRTRARCSAGWLYGDLGFTGRLAMRSKREGEDVYTLYSMRVVKMNYYCAATGGKKCTRTYR